MNKSKKTKERRSVWQVLDRCSVRWKLIVYMSVFIAIVLMVVWVFQVFLLDVFYRSIKKTEMEDAARVLAMCVGSDDLEITAFGEAVDHSLCVGVYRIEDSTAKQLVAVDATGSNLALSLTKERLHEFYLRASENAGSYSTNIAFGGIEVDENLFLDRLPFHNGDGYQKIPIKNIRLMYVSLASDAIGNEYMILMDSSIQPLEGTVQTLIRQYLWIAVIILISAAIMVVLLYQKISEPLAKMNESAKQLALGKYDVEFVEGGYLETRELAGTLNYARRELSRVDTLQKELIANISHDLRTPLTMIRGYGEMMRDIPDENTSENMQIIIDETARLSELVNDLLDLSKIQSGTMPANLEPINLTDLISETMNRYEALVKHQGYRVIFDEKNTAVEVNADRGMLLQVLYNLINNAINYTGDDKAVTVIQTVNDDRVRISITDTGEGISPEEMPLIWDRYYKIDKVHKRAMIGTGLGLSIVKSILELHGAAYGVNSIIGVGSVFWFEFPIIKTEK